MASTCPKLKSPHGRYFLKTNFGAGNNVSVRFPLDATTRKTLLAKQKTWFERRHRHGFWAGEWWYQTISTRVYLEEGQAIAQNLEFARVDFFLRDQHIYLGEITLCPFGAKKKMRSAGLDRRLGAAWRGSRLFPDDADLRPA